MSSLERIVAAHPLGNRKPYNAIKFARVDGRGTPLYTVGKGTQAYGALEALRTAFEWLGGHCFHCGTWMEAQPLSQNCTRDHLRLRVQGGSSYLHNLVLACGTCNREKGGADLISFRPEAGSEYLAALEEHLVRCIKHLPSG